MKVHKYGHFESNTYTGLFRLSDDFFTKVDSLRFLENDFKYLETSSWYHKNCFI